MKKKIYFRADASVSIGYGHFIRTLALADMLKNDFDCTFFTQTPTEYQKSEVEKVCSLYALPSDDSKFQIFLNILEGDEIVVLDNYFFTTEYQQYIKAKGCKIVCIDDMHDKHYVADVVINHGIEDENLISREHYTKLCLGLKWALLRKPFLLPRTNLIKEKGHWLIAFGGSDSYNLTRKFVQLVNNNKSVKKISVIIGDAYCFSDSLKGGNNIEIYKNLSADQMAELMCRCEYAVLPSSSICIEAISQGCKIYSGYYVDNQKEIYKYLKDIHVIYPWGNLGEVADLKLSNEHFFKIDNLKEVLQMIPLRYRLLFNSDNNKSEIYGNLIFKDYITLSINEHEKILNMRNDDRIRMNMDSVEKISWKNHCAFLSSLFNNSEKRYWAVYDQKEFIGSVNINLISKNVVERGIYIKPDLIGESVGTKIEKATEILLKKSGISEIRAKVLHENINSLKFHYKNNYTSISRDEKYEYLIKVL